MGLSSTNQDVGVDDTAAEITVNQEDNNYRAVIVKGISANGTDGYWTRGNGYSPEIQAVFAEEDQVEDEERSHTSEMFSWASFETDMVIYGKPYRQ